MSDQSNYRDYESEVCQVLEERIRREAPGALFQIVHDRKILGKSGHEHQIDVSAELQLAGLKLLILAECKKYCKKVSIDDVLTFAKRMEDVSAQKGIMVTTVGFQKGAEVFAKASGISLVKKVPGAPNSWEVTVPLLVGFVGLSLVEPTQALPADTGPKPAASQTTRSRRWWQKKRVRAFMSVFIVTTLWLVFPRESKVVIRDTFFRPAQDFVLTIVSRLLPHRISPGAKLKRHAAWIANDFSEDPLSILRTLDHVSLKWTNRKTGVVAKLNVVIPYTNHFDLLMNGLNPPPTEVRSDWNISDDSNDERFNSMLSNTRKLRLAFGSVTEVATEERVLAWSEFLPFSGEFSEESERLSAATNRPLKNRVIFA